MSSNRTGYPLKFLRRKKVKYPNWYPVSECYSCPHLVRPKSEELISLPFVGEIQFQLVLLKPMGTESAIGCLIFIHQVLLFCPTHAHIIRSSMGVSGRICSEAGRMDFSANKSNRPASEQILLATPMDERMMSACLGKNKSTWWIKKQAAYCRLRAHGLL